MKTRFGLMASAVTVILVIAGPAYACPSCALNDKGGIGSWFILAGMITFPFLVVGVTIKVLRKLAPAETRSAELAPGDAARMGPRGF